MKIVFIHYHLKTGGVTSVIRQQTRILQSAGCHCFVLSGQDAPPGFETPWAVVPGLAYDALRAPDLSARDVAETIDRIIRTRWSKGADVVHVHNPTLAKNSLFQDILNVLKDMGHCLLCQIHDFAEDGRPDFFFQQGYTADCHYAVLNKRDHTLLLSSGLKPEGVHLLPNPVQPLGLRVEYAMPAGGPVLYPVRAIRRKNLGEALLLSLFFKPDAPLFITLPPNSAQDIRSYQDWRTFAARQRFKVAFDIGLTHEFRKLVTNCRFILTTSITEGFGYAFLEAWTGSRMVRGRLLPEICSDFIDQGIQLDHLYRRLAVPLAWLDGPSLSKRWRNAYVHSAARLGLTITQDEAQNVWDQAAGQGTIDFGLLHEDFQKQALLRLLHDQNAAEELMALNAFLACAPLRDANKRVDHNRRIVEAYYSLANYRDMLLRVYHQVKKIQVNHSLDKAGLAAAFLTPQTFSLLKWTPYHG